MVALTFSSHHRQTIATSGTVDAGIQDSWEIGSNGSTGSASSLASRVSALRVKLTLSRRPRRTGEPRPTDWDALLAGCRVGETCEVKSALTVRTQESLESEAKAVLKPGSVFEILELGPGERRRARISAKAAQGLGVEGWISLATAGGELIVGDVPRSRRGSAGGVEFVPKYLRIKRLLEASSKGDLAVVKRIAEGSGAVPMLSSDLARPSLNCCDVFGKTPLMYAAGYANYQVVAYLLLLNSDEVEVNATDGSQRCALHHAAQRPETRAIAQHDEAQSAIVRLLVDCGACVEARDHNGGTALMLAAENGDAIVAQALLAARANVNVKDFEGKAPLDYASRYGHRRVEVLLKDAGATERDDDEEACEVPTSLARCHDNFEDIPSNTHLTMQHGAPGHDSDESSRPDATSEHPQDSAPRSGSKAPAPAGVTGAAAAREEVPLVAVVDSAETEGADGRRQALAKLNAITDSSASARELESAIREALSAGVDDEELLSARLRWKELKERTKVFERLRKAIADRDPKALKKYIAKAEEAAVSRDVIDGAKRVLSVEKPKQKAREGLQAAQESGNAEKLRLAIATAEKVGLGSGELAGCEELLKGAESKQAAETTLKAATAERNMQHLRFAIQQARDTGVDSKHVEHAEAVLRDEGPKQEARNLLAEACERGTAVALGRAIEGARAARLGAPECAGAVAQLAQLEERERSLGTVRAVMQEVGAVDRTSTDALRGAKDNLGRAIADAVALGVAESDLREAESQRKRLHNLVEDLKGSIRVICRVRPLSGKEKSQGDREIAHATDSMTLKVEDAGAYQFDAVFTPGTQEEVFEDCRDLVQSAVDGYNVTMFAYGQTGAGKTFTMYGAPGTEGTAPRTIEEIFRVIGQGRCRFDYTVMGSMLELYRNDLVDLLNKGDPNGSKPRPLNVRQERSGAVAVEHLAEEECRSAAELSALLQRGSAQRTVAATAMNSESSRSHLVLQIRIVSVNRETKEKLVGKILICDLAGSERIKKSQVTDDMQREAIEINKSLTALGDVIEALTRGRKVVPYRNHKLTQLMQDSLGGTAKTLMFVNCSPADSNLDETVMSLKYATRAKKITNVRK